MGTNLPGMAWEAVPFPGRSLQSVVDKMEKNPCPPLALRENICSGIHAPELPVGPGWV